MNALTWFEIPARDIGRAQAFYEKLLGLSLKQEAFGPLTMVVFPSTEPGVGGCIQVGEGTTEPSLQGSVVYLPAVPTLDAVLARLGAAGGRALTPKITLPGDMGVFAHIEDSEGNRVGLHARA
jgi:uncharacterized protein